MQQLTLPVIQEQHIPMTYAEYLTAFDESAHAEWVNGEAILFMPPDIRHQDIVAVPRGVAATPTLLLPFR